MFDKSDEKVIIYNPNSFIKENIFHINAQH